MANLTIRNLDEALLARLRRRAAKHGVSMEDEARGILRATLEIEPHRPENLAQSIRARIAPLGGIDLPDVFREAIREKGKGAI